MIRFFLLTGKEFASLEAPDPEAIYFIRDEHRIQTAGVDFCSGVSGFGQIAGGYAAAVSAYSNTGDAVTVTLHSGSLLRRNRYDKISSGSKYLVQCLQ